MPKQVSAQPEEKDSTKQHIKKLRKREQRLLGRLEEAQKRYESAQTRLQRAEERLQKRQERLERLRARLALLHQQLQAAAEPTLPEEVTAQHETTMPPAEAAEPSRESTVAEVAEPAPEVTEPDVSAPSLLAVENTVVESAAEEVSLVIELAEPEQQPTAEYHEEEEEAVSIPTAADIPVAIEPASISEKNTLINEARAVARAAEEAAQVATMRAHHMLDHLEQMLDGRDLSRELEQLETESVTLSSLAHDALRMVDLLVQLSVQSNQEEICALVAQKIERQRQMLASVRTSLDFSAPDTGEAMLEHERCQDADSIELLDLDEDEIIFDLPSSAFIDPASVPLPRAASGEEEVEGMALAARERDELHERVTQEEPCPSSEQERV